ncbi:MAG: sigma-70 family RNA polymerase sigma factor [Methylotenera sp.]|nr:sigma-70 family RNA polymerase sigma factor [Methylotenera sp.]
MAINSINTPADLAEMLAKTGQGDRQAFAQLYQATSAKLFGLALRILASRDLAEEALQDAFVKIWHSADTYKADKAAVMTWMTAIVRNRCLDLLRAAPKEQGLNEDESFDDWANDDMGPMETAATRSDTKALMQCMKQLAPLQRQAFALSYFHGLAHEQLALQLAQPLGTVKTWLRRGLETLKNCMGASGISEQR